MAGRAAGADCTMTVERLCSTPLAPSAPGLLVCDDNEKGVNNTGNPVVNCQPDIDDRLDRFTAEQDGQRGSPYALCRVGEHDREIVLV